MFNDSISAESGFLGAEYLTNRDGSEYFCQVDENPPFECSSLQPGTSCVSVGNPERGLNHFDNIVTSIITAFEMITLEGWSGVMYQIRMSRGGFSLEGDLFCTACVIFGALFVLNLMIAVQFDFLNEAFDEIEQKKAKEKAEQEKELKEGRLYEENEADVTAFAPGEEMEDANQTK